MIVIKNMKMPKSCSQCHLCVEDKYADMTCVLLCEEWKESNYNENHRDENCPLMEIITCKAGAERKTDADIRYEYAVEEYDENGRFYLQYEVYSSLNEAKKGLKKAKAENACASLDHSFGILKIVYKNGSEIETERME